MDTCTKVCMDDSYAHFSLCSKNIPSLLATASNTWGLLILTVLLGYGLVEIPRSLWNTTRRRHTMNHCYFKAAKLYVDLAEADDNLKEVTEVMRAGKVVVVALVR